MITPQSPAKDLNVTNNVTIVKSTRSMLSLPTKQLLSTITIIPRPLTSMKGRIESVDSPL